MKLLAEHVCIAFEKKSVLRDVGLEVRPGEFVGLIGPNGSGKSTLLKSIYRVSKPDAGWISLDGEDVYRLSSRENAQRMAVVRQESSVEFDFTVIEIVMMGRSPHKRLFQADTEEDRIICEKSLSQVGMLGKNSVC
jgi:iron complex transport system ATP-binding protein